MKKCYNCASEVEDAYKYCPHCGVSQTEINCPNCSYKNVPNSNFCQECGFDLNNQISVKQQRKSTVDVVKKPVPDHGVTIEFDFSTSQTFELAVDEAKKFESYREFGEGKRTVRRVTVTEDQIEQLGPLLETLKGWRNRRVYHNGEKTLWNSIFSYYWCYRRREASYKPKFYCFGYENNYDFNLWGCIQARLGFRENSELFTYGKWLNTKGDWEFDKEKISHYIEKNIFQYRFCPAMDLKLIKDVLGVFPERVNPSNDENWTFVRNWSSQDGLKIVRNNYGYREEIYVNGAAPVSMKKFVSDINKKLHRKLPNEFG